MSKKIIPIITLLGASAFIVGVSLPAGEKKENISNHIESFSQDVSNYVSANANLSTSALNKYTLSLQENLDDIPSLDTLSANDRAQADNEISKTITDDDNDNITTPNEINDNDNTENINNDNNDEIQELETSPIDDEELSQISTLYSLSNDIETSCGEFCELKEQISNAIIETQNLIEKVQNNEIELTNEQRLFITEQAQQLKNLGRQLSNITTELSFNLSDLSLLMKTNNQNIDNLSLKYLVVLDNLVNGNEMLQSGLSSLNLINQMFNLRSSGAEANNHGRILYGFQHNNNPPIIKDYYIDENGNVVENNNTKTENNENPESVSDKKTNIDTYKNSNLTTNLDTYNNSNLNHNIDSFFNTALLDNEFMYGNNYGYGMNGYNNPYMNHYQHYEKNTTSNGVNHENNTQNDVDKQNQTNQTNKENKRFKLKKNIDTFKDENEPSIKTKLGNIKNSITNFFSRSKKLDLNDKIDNPIYRYKASNKE